MKNFFKPAISLLNNLKYPIKFMVIGTLLVIPFIMIFYLLITNIYDETQSAKKQRVGIQYIYHFANLLEELEHHRGLESIYYSTGNKPFFEMLKTKQSKIDTHIDAIATYDHQQTNSLESVPEWNDLLDKWQWIKENDALNDMKLYLNMDEDIFNLISYISDYYDLNNVPKSDSFYLMSGIVRELPSSIINLALIRDLAVNHNPEQNLTSEETEEILQLKYLVDFSMKNHNDNLRLSFTHNPYLVLKIEKYNLDSLDKKKIFWSSINAIRKDTDHFINSPVMLYVAGTDAINAIFKLYKSEILVMDDLLKARIDDSYHQIHLFSVFTSFVFLLALYLFMGFYFSVNRTVWTLEDVSKRVSTGDLTVRVNLDTRDELRTVGRSFNEMIESFSNMINKNKLVTEQLRIAQEELVDTLRQQDAMTFKFKEMDGRFIHTLCNGRLLYRFGLSPEQVVGRELCQFLSAEQAAAKIDYYHRAWQGHEDVTYEGELNGISYFSSLTPIKRDGQVVEVIGFSVDISERKQAEETIKKLAYHDSLTGLPNRFKFNKHCNQMLTEAMQNKQMLAMMYLDLDRFKFINDTLGHDNGDLLLKAVAKRITDCLRQDEMVSRQGGDEFAILLQDMTREKTLNVAQRLVEVLGRPYNLNGHEVYVTPSIGISLYPNHGDDLETLIKHADIAMYHAKQNGKNNYFFFNPAMKVAIPKKLELEKGLRQALEREEFIIYYQPQLNLSTGELLGMEALIRWQHPTMGIISPGEFIPLAEENGLIIPIGEWVLHNACIQNKAWIDKGLPAMRITVNLSPRQLQQEDLVGAISRILEETGLEPQYLGLEITETISMYSDPFFDKLHQLKELGIHISIDDFGTGYSSLGYLRKFPIDTLKIDKSFISGIPTNEENTAIVTAIVAMAKSLQLEVIAEGVENQEQLSLLGSLGCYGIQGYFISPPIPANEIQKLLADNKPAYRLNESNKEKTG
jgi:diguanylate cyclase (GGDEF)-like protein/PAS domain S-box-containing protein